MGQPVQGPQPDQPSASAASADQTANPLTTKASTALLDKFGNPTGDDLAGAVTVTLTDQESALAAGGNLWVQGGVPGDPVLNAVFPDTYGFAALRCAVDNLNGDNVEFTRFPSGSTHVFCYAYYVTPPPTSGTIIITKRVDVDPPQVYSQDFAFKSNITYNASGQFILGVNNNAAASATFIRGEMTREDAAVAGDRARPRRLAAAVPHLYEQTRHQYHQHRRTDGCRSTSRRPIPSPAPT